MRGTTVLASVVGFPRKRVKGRLAIFRQSEPKTARYQANTTSVGGVVARTRREFAASSVIWRAPFLPPARLLWRHLRICLELVDIAGRTTVLEAQPYTDLARGLLDRALRSCQFWWASRRPMFDLNMIERGLEEQRAVMINAMKAVTMSKAPTACREAAEDRQAIAEDMSRKGAAAAPDGVKWDDMKNHVLMLESSSASPHGRVLGGGRDILDDIRHLCGSLGALSDGCASRDGRSQPGESCGCCNAVHSHQIPAGRECVTLLARLKIEIDTLTVETIWFFPVVGMWVSHPALDPVRDESEEADALDRRMKEMR